MEIIFQLNNKIMEDMDWEDLELIERTMEGENKSTYKIRNIMARYMLREDGFTPIPYDEAELILKRVKLSKLRETIKSFGTSLNGIAVPKVSGIPSEQPSTQAMVESPSLVG